MAQLNEKLDGTHTNVGTAEETALQLPHGGPWVLLSFYYTVTGGTGANYAASLGTVAGYSANDVGEIATHTSGVVATPTKTVYAQPVPFTPDANNQIHLQPRFDAGADNDGEYIVYCRPAGPPVGA